MSVVTILFGMCLNTRHLKSLVILIHLAQRGKDLHNNENTRV